MLLMTTPSLPNNYNIQCDFVNVVNLIKLADEPSSLPKTLIFCRTKDAAVNVYRLLINSAHYKECVGMFHASLTQDTKTTTVENFQSRNSPLWFLVATVAFGMVCKPLQYAWTYTAFAFAP